MRPDEAGELFALLPANYPRTKITDDTARLWLDALGRLDHRLGESAVRSLIAAAKFWPSLAELFEHVAIVREQVARERREAERHEAEREFDLIPRPPLREIPAAVELLDRFGTAPLDLERVVDGPCRDCARVGPRYLLGSVHVCERDARLRLRVAGRAAHDPNTEAA